MRKHCNACRKIAHIAVRSRWLNHCVGTVDYNLSGFHTLSGVWWLMKLVGRDACIHLTTHFQEALDPLSLLFPIVALLTATLNQVFLVYGQQGNPFYSSLLVSRGGVIITAKVQERRNGREVGYPSSDSVWMKSSDHLMFLWAHRSFVFICTASGPLIRVVEVVSRSKRIPTESRRL
jgi:hypothetical protein